MYKKREADKLIVKLKAEFKELTGRDIEIRYKAKGATKRASMRTYAFRVATAYGIRISDLRIKNRKMVVVIPRWVFVYICSANRYKPHEIADYLQNERTTVYNAIESLRRLMEEDIELEEKVNNLLKGRKCI